MTNINDADRAEIERLRCLHRGVISGLNALNELYERSPEDELRLRALVRLEQRLMDRMEWIATHCEPKRAVKVDSVGYGHPAAAAGAPDSSAAWSA